MAYLQSYIKYGVIVALSYFSPIIGIVIAVFTKVKKLDEKIMFSALIGSIGALFMYSIDFIYLSLK